VTAPTITWKRPPVSSMMGLRAGRKKKIPAATA
jgi:hypothetical protein